MGKTRTKRNGRRRMRGGFLGFGESSTPADDNSNSIFSGWGEYFKKFGQKSSPSPQQSSSMFGTYAAPQQEQSSSMFGTSPASQQSPSMFGSQGGRRRRKKMRGGDPMPNTPFTTAMELQDIKMASPQTLVGGRRRRKSSRRSRKSSRRY